METNRQKKIGKLLQVDLATTLQKLLKENNITNVLISVSKVWVSTDLSVAKAYLSVFPAEKKFSILEEVKTLQPKIRYQLAQLTRNQLRKIPEFLFFIDDTAERQQAIDEALKGTENPIESPDILPKRQKK
ncbi:MAG: ribosome-binding factor A [Flavobacteriaceae bacterium]|nr:ribosome-binding factor A [Flavobacteriaceae bacterium]